MQVAKCRKMDGRYVVFNPEKIHSSIIKAIINVGQNGVDVDSIVQKTLEILPSFITHKIPTTEEIAQAVEKALMDLGYSDIAKAYIVYRNERANQREGQSALVKAVAKISQEANKDNANTPPSFASKLLQISEAALKTYNLRRVLPERIAVAHEKGYIHIHDIFGYGLAWNCLSIPLRRLLLEGFKTGNGRIRPPRRMNSIMALAAIILQCNQNEMVGGQAYSHFDFDIAEVIRTNCKQEPTEDEIYQAIEGFIYNLNTMQSLPYEELIWVFDKKTQKLDIIEIGKFCEEIYEPGRFQAISANRENGRAELKDITAVWKHENKNSIIKIVGYDGREVSCTLNHSLIQINRGKGEHLLVDADAASIKKLCVLTNDFVNSPLGSMTELEAYRLGQKFGYSYLNTDEVPNEILLANQSVIRAFLQGYISIRGRKHKTKILIYTPSEKFKYGLQLLFARLHIRVGIREFYRKLPGTDETERTFAIFLLDRKWEFPEPKVVTEVSIQNKIPSQWRKYVYDISVSDNENFILADCTLVHNSRYGGQKPFSNIIIGTDTSELGRKITLDILDVMDKGMDGFTFIWPNVIFRIKEGINYEPGTPNHDLLICAYEVAAKRMNPTFLFMDSSFNAKYGEEATSMGCRTRVIASVTCPEVIDGRGNISFTTINLPRLAIESNGNQKLFMDLLDKYLELVEEQLIHRLKLTGTRKKRDFPFLLGENLYMESEKLRDDDYIYPVLIHGTQTIGFVGLEETVKLLTGYWMWENNESLELGYNIIKHMREFTDEMIRKHRLNFSLLATPAESVAGRFCMIDKEMFGVIEGITDKEFYNNSHHMLVDAPISIFEKIEKEGKFHALCNGGHIGHFYLESGLQGNIKAIQQLIDKSKEADMGYVAVNFPINECWDCKYSDPITRDRCPKCGSERINRIRRITGYLAPTITWGHGKLMELNRRKDK